MFKKTRGCHIMNIISLFRSWVQLIKLIQSICNPMQSFDILLYAYAFLKKSLIAPGIVSVLSFSKAVAASMQISDGLPQYPKGVISLAFSPPCAQTFNPSQIVYIQ